MEKKSATLEVGNLIRYKRKDGIEITAHVTKVFDKEFHGVMDVAVNIKLVKSLNGRKNMTVRASACELEEDNFFEGVEDEEVEDEEVEDEEEPMPSNIKLAVLAKDELLKGEQMPTPESKMRTFRPVMRKAGMIVKFNKKELVTLLNNLNKSGARDIEVELREE